MYRLPKKYLSVNEVRLVCHEKGPTKEYHPLLLAYYLDDPEGFQTRPI